MDFKHFSWILVIVAFSIHLFGLVNCFLLLIGFLFFIIGCFCAIYPQRGDLDSFLNSNGDNPLEAQKALGLNLVGDQKPIVLITPNIKIQTESRKHKSPQHQSLSNQQQHSLHSSLDPRKKSLLDTGIELLFKKHQKHVKEGYACNIEHNKEHNSGASCSSTSSNNSNNKSTVDEKKWKPFENIKIYTDRKRSSGHGIEKLLEETIQFGEDIAGGSPYKYQVTHSTDAHLLDDHGSPKKKRRAMLSGNKQIDQLLHTIIDFILRDFIDSWFCSLSDNKEFSEFRVRNCIEECVINVSTRVKNTSWIPLMTTKMIDDIANHVRLYRYAKQAINAQNAEKLKASDKTSPQRKSKKLQHKRNKSDTDLEWYGTTSGQKSVSNSKFYTEVHDEKLQIDPEENLINSFFNQSNLFHKECTDDRELEKYLTQVMETILYFTLPEEDFACIPLRTFLSSLLANVIFKPILEMLSEPDFINLHVAKVFAKEPPPVDHFLRALRQSTNLSELRACRQFITREMNAKYKESKSSPELASLHFAQKLIDLRISYLQNSKNFQGSEREKISSKLPTLPLDELLFKEIARYYFLDYLNVHNLQKYVIFYLTADEWKCMSSQSVIDLQSNKLKSSKEEIYRNLKERAQIIYDQFLDSRSPHYLSVDQGLIKALTIKIKDPSLLPENNWFDSICKFVYEKLKNEEIFLTKFYQSSAYKKLLLELEVVEQQNEPDIDHLPHFTESGSDTNSGDINIECDLTETAPSIKTEMNLQLPKPDLLDVTNYKHFRSHSDCTGIVPSFSDLNLNTQYGGGGGSSSKSDRDSSEERSQYNMDDGGNLNVKNEITQERAHSAPSRTHPTIITTEYIMDMKQKLTARIINTAILQEGQYAVYAIQVTIIEGNERKSWHIYRRYSKFLELKKILIKRYPAVSRIPFPAKKAFHNTQRSVLEHRMDLLNNFLIAICNWAEDNEDMMRIIREFLEPDTDDRKIHGGGVIKTIETLVNPLKTGMRTIRNMPDTLVGGFSKILLGKGPLKEPSFLEVNLEQSSEYPALTSAIHLLDEVFDLQARSQWLRRGIINRVLGAPWISHTVDKKIIHAAKSLIEVDKIEHLLSIILKSIWPDGVYKKHQVRKDENTKLRTRLAAQMALFALLFDDLKRVVGSETTRSGLLNSFEMWQHKKLNLRLALVLLNNVLTTLYKVDNMTKHVNE